MSVIRIHIQTPEKEWAQVFEQSEITIGRGGDALPDLQILDATVSRWHGRIWLDVQGYWFEDTSSSYGSEKNKTEVIGAVRIFAGDVLALGESVLTIEEADISTDELDVSELFDVQLQNSVNLLQESPLKNRPSAKVQVIAQQGWSSTPSVVATEFSSNFFGNMVSIFEKEPQLNEALIYAIEDIVRLFDPVERGAVLLLDDTGKELSVAAHYPLFEPAISTTLIRRTIKDNKAFIWKASDSNFSSDSVKKLRIKTGLYSPLAFGANQLGVVCADTTSNDDQITRQDLELFVNVTKVLASLILAKKAEQA